MLSVLTIAKFPNAYQNHKFHDCFRPDYYLTVGTTPVLIASFCNFRVKTVQWQTPKFHVIW